MRTVAPLLLASALAISPNTQAAPWLAPGDARARYSAQALADAGHVDRTTSTWPLMWDNLRSHEAPDDATRNAHAYLAFERREQAQQGLRGTVSLSGATEQQMVRGFRGGPDESGDLNLTLQWQGDRWAAGLSPSYTKNPQDDKDWRLDGSYLAATAGNWVIGAGKLDRWWGPGWQSSLILSNNARPLPAIWLNRRNARAPQSELLSWIGPWDFTVFAGEMESSRTIPDARLIGMRLTLRPVQGLDIGLSRILQLDGEGRPSDASVYWDALVGKDNDQDEADSPGNQLGAIDIRYGLQTSETTTLGIYTQMVGEYEAGQLPAKKSWLFGMDATSALAGGNQQWYLEYTNTITDDLFGDTLPGVTYEHSAYTTGYRYRGRSMAASQGGDAEVTTLGGWHFLASGSQIGASITHARLNQFGAIGQATPTTGSVNYLVPAGDQQFTLATLSYGTEILTGWLDVEARYTSEAPMLRNGTELDQWQIAGQWRYRF